MAEGERCSIMTRMSDRRKDLRPREKLQTRGAEALSDYELLMAVIGSGTAQADVTKTARDVQRLLAEKGSALTYDDLLSIKSLGPAKAQFLNFETLCSLFGND